MQRVMKAYNRGGIRQIIGAALRVLERRINPQALTPGYIDPITAIRMAVPGMLVEGNVVAMDYAIKNLPSDNPILEIGSFAGLSACVMSCLLEKHGRTNTIICVDPWQWEGMNDEDEILPWICHRDYMLHVRQQWLSNTVALCKRYPYPVPLKSDAFFKSCWKEPIAFAYIDGDHRYEQAKRDFLNVDRWLEKGGFILFDDTGDEIFGCAKLMPEVKATGRYEMIMQNPNHLWRRIK